MTDDESRPVRDASDIRLASAQSGALSTEAIARMRHDPDERVRVALIHNPNISGRDLGLLARTDTSEQVRRAAFGELGERGEINIDPFTGGVKFASGAFGDLYLVDRDDGSRVVQKVFSYKGASQHLERSRERFVRGAHLMRDHLSGAKRIVEVEEIYDEDTSTPWFVMEYVPGVDLSELVQTPKEALEKLHVEDAPDLEGDFARLPLELVVNILLDVCAAVRYAHSQSIVHRDIKPRNVLLYNSDGKIRAKITDFDLAYIPGYQEITGSSMYFGTQFSPPWLQINDSVHQRLIDVPMKTDLRVTQIDDYGVAATIFYAITGVMPSAGGSFVEDRVRQELSRVAGRRYEEPVTRLLALVREILSATRPGDMRSGTSDLQEVLVDFWDVPRSDDVALGSIFCWSSPRDRQRIDVDVESKIADRAAKDVAGIEVLESISAAKIEDLLNALVRNDEARLLWLGGHGSNEEFVFEAGDRDSAGINADQMALMLRPFLPPGGRLQCLVVNSCESAELAERVAELLRIPFVVGVRGVVDDAVALAFSEGMIDGLGNFRGYPESFELGIARVAGRFTVADAAKFEMFRSEEPAFGILDGKRMLARVRDQEEMRSIREDAFAGLARTGAELVTEAYLAGCDISDLNCAGMKLNNSDLRNTVARHTGFRSADLSACSGKRADLTTADLNEAILRASSWEAAAFVDVNANDLDAVDAYFLGANWAGSTCTNADFTNCDLSSANLARANLSRASFVDALLDGADLTNAIMSRSNCTRTRFGSADVAGVDFSRTVLRGADLSSVRNIFDAGFFRPTYDSTTQWPPDFDLPEPGNEGQAA